MTFEGDYFVDQVWPVFVIITGVIFVFSCLCFLCPCCPWYKRRRQGVVYQNITHPPGTTVEIISSQNTTGYPITQQVCHPPQHTTYPTQQVIYPGQQVCHPTQQAPVPPYGQQACHPTQQVPVPPCATFQTPAPNYGPSMQPQVPQYGQPPPYTEVANMPTAPGQSVQEAYTKQAPFNPYYPTNNQ